MMGGRRTPRLGWLFASPEGVTGTILTGIVLLMLLLGRFIAPHSPNETDLSAVLRPPSAFHLFGTDESGRDLFSRVLFGAGNTLPAAFGVVACSLVLGALVGTIAGYFRGWVGNVLMRVTDLFLSYPALLLAIAVSASLGQGLLQASMALVVVVWAGYARLAYVQTVTIRHRLYMDAAEIAGTSVMRRIGRHLVPNIMPPLLVKATMDVAFCVEWIASLGFIGLGAVEPTPEWGAMIATSRGYALASWWYVLFPAVALLITIIGFVLLGSAFEEHLSGRGTLGRRALRRLAVSEALLVAAPEKSEAAKS